MGTGKLGTFKNHNLFDVKDVAQIFIDNLKDTPELIPNKIIELLQFAPNMLKPLDILVKIALKELDDDNVSIVANKYAKIIKKDFVIPGVSWCGCFVTNLQKKIEETMRELKFSIN